MAISQTQLKFIFLNGAENFILRHSIRLKITMEYYKLVAVTGLPGLYELISSKKDGAVIRSLQDNTTRFASTRIHQFSHLESIEIYTTADNVNLVDIFKAMDANEYALPDVKDDVAVLAYFKKVYPDMDFHRVYKSDMKKMVKWFDILKQNKIEPKLSEPETTESDEVENDNSNDVAAADTQEKQKSAKKEVKKEVEKKENKKIDNTVEKEKAPAKKAAPKKAAAKKTATKAAPKKKAD